MNYELLVLDLDGTLTNSRKEITPATRQALIEIQEAGKKVVLASGRADSGVLPLAKELLLDKYGSYILTYNGGRVRRCDTGEFICNLAIPHEVIQPICEIIREYPGIDLAADTDEAIYSGIQANKYTELESIASRLPLVPVDDLAETLSFPVNALLVTGDPDALTPIEKRLNDLYSPILSIYRSEPFFLEIMPPNIDKLHSLQELLKHMNLTPDKMICCGDGYNDLTMIQYAGLGVAMENAIDIVKEAADFITKSNDEDGVLHVIDLFMRD